MNKQKRILAALAIFYTSSYTATSWADSKFEYSAITLSYARELSSVYQQKPQRLGAELSIEVSPQSFIYAGTQSGWVQSTLKSDNDSQSVEHTIATNTIQLGYGGHYSLSDNTDVYGRLGLLLNKIDADTVISSSTSISTSTDRSSTTGMDSEIGLRHFINTAQTIELTPSLQFTQIHSQPHTKVSIAISYHFSNKVQIQTGYGYDLDTKAEAFSVDFRLYGKSF